MTATLESVWEHREESIYPALFGPMSRGIFPLNAEQFTETFKQETIDPRWLHYGVFEFAPTESRSSWLYATSGFSNPWHQEPGEYAESEFSGFGSELVLEAPNQFDWAVRALTQLLAYDILLAHGKFGDFDPLSPGARVPLGGPINGDPASRIRFAAIGMATHYSPTFQLASGQVDLFHVVGITESERDWAKQNGTDALIEALSEQGAFPVTDLSRKAVV